ncbi:hypothetical protein [Microbacterium jejuense]|uniref:hypothetical protein n=1 Tax=Microbacterium jejuense TaxID=1263637 RepID=UPI0031ED213F
MPTFQDPVVDGEEACQALRALAHATRSFDQPAQTYAVVGDVLGGLRSLEQVLEQLASAHTSETAIARTDDGDPWAGIEEAHAAASALRRASTLVARAGLAVDQASVHSGRIAWGTDTPAALIPLTESIAPRIDADDSFQRATGRSSFPRAVTTRPRRSGMSL